MTYFEIARVLARKRISLLMSQQTLAEQTGLNRGTISTFENCRQIPDVRTISRIADALGFKLEIILTEDPNQTEDPDQPEPLREITEEERLEIINDCIRRI